MIPADSITKATGGFKTAPFITFGFKLISLFLSIVIPCLSLNKDKTSHPFNLLKIYLCTYYYI